MNPQIYVLTLLHFNIQYCAGGLDGLWQDWPVGNDDIEDQIVEESFEPVLDMLAGHPDWTIDIEMQGYMVDVLARRHPGVLDELRALNQDGQVELVSFHWSDQLWTAFPWRDQQVSLELTARAFEDAGLELSPVVFTQEGQFGEGMIERMPGAGYQVALLPRNLASYLWGDAPRDTLYARGDVLVLPTWSAVSPDGSYEVQWSFVDDGELLATGGMDPYMGPYFVHDPQALADFESDLAARERGGALISGVGEFVEAVRGGGASELPPVLDGTWQPDDSDNLYRWMGGAGLWADGEDDDGVRTANVRAGLAVAAAERVAGEDDPTVIEAWREALLGEVSDASGWNPYPTEVAYGLDHARAAQRLACEAVGPWCAKHGASEIEVDLSPGGAITADPGEAAGARTPSGAPEGPTPSLPGRPGALSWSRDGSRDDVWWLDVTFEIGSEAPVIAFPWDALDYRTTAALVDDELQVVGASEVAADPVSLALPVGLAHLRDDWWLVERTGTVHLAGTFSRADSTLTFRDETAKDESTPAWSFALVQGEAARALEVARTLNVEPTVRLACPPAEPAAAGGCGCGSGPRASLPGWLLPLAFLLRRRRAPAAL